jgi:hypothetical protein
MMLRARTVTLIAVSGLLLLAESAGAISSTTRACVVATRKARANCITMCRTDYFSTFAACYGPGSMCAAGCLNDQANCQSGPNTMLSDCKLDTLFCSDGNPNGVNGCSPANATIGNCGETLKTVLKNCNTDPNPEVCASNARLDNLRCQQACQLLFAPALQTCNQNFSDCTGSCASCRSQTDCPH